MRQRPVFACVGCVVSVTALLALWPLCLAGVVPPQPTDEFSSVTSRGVRAVAPVTAQSAPPRVDTVSATALERVEAPVRDELAGLSAEFAVGTQGSPQAGTGVSTRQRVLAQFMLNKQQYMNQLEPISPALLGMVGGSR